MGAATGLFLGRRIDGPARLLATEADAYLAPGASHLEARHHHHGGDAGEDDGGEPGGPLH